MPSKNPEVHRRNVRKYYQRHKEQIYKRRNDQRKERVRRFRKEILELLGNKCEVCNESDWRCLQIDHVNGGGNQERKKLYNLDSRYKYMLEKIRNGSKDYQILCSNCNWKKYYSDK